MADLIRTVHPAEFSEFARFLERCYRASIGAFERAYPHLYRPDEDACACFHVLEHEGRIVSHVGLFPIEIVTNGVSLTVGGIGGVATLPEARGHGFMSQLLRHVIDVMRERGYPLSWLGGDRQRYNSFGWEVGGLIYDLRFSKRSLDRAGVEAVPIQEVRAPDALNMVERLQPSLLCRSHLPQLELRLLRRGLRAWLAEDGYILSYGGDWGRLSVTELASASGREVGMIRSLLPWNADEAIRWAASAWDQERLARVMPAVAWWEARNDQMYRIVHLDRLLEQARPTLSARAEGLRDFELCIEIHEPDRVHAATIVVHGGQIEVQSGRHTMRTVVLTPVTAVRLLLGGPAVVAPHDLPAELGMLFPIPAHVPTLSDV